VSDVFEIRIPQLSMEIAEATISQWIATDGALVEEGNPLYEIETDKVSTIIDSPVSGKLEILADTETLFDVGVLIGRIHRS
jgi:pyruvate/2-oxoglutarate dehydrogenase complex dihydrolipoamide acyltransferase (E2) component